MVGLRISIKGGAEAERALAAMGDRAENPAPVWEEIGRILVESTQNRFEQQRDPEGNPWPPSIRVLVEGGNTLRDTGRLYASITYELLQKGVAVGTNVFFAAVHQFGATIRAKTDEGLMFKVAGHFVRKDQVTIPRRAFLGVDRDDEESIAFAWEEYLGQPVGGVVNAH